MSLHHLNPVDGTLPLNETRKPTKLHGRRPGDPCRHLSPTKRRPVGEVVRSHTLTYTSRNIFV